ncbi:unnamed protein product [Linum tenue]|uniref:Pentatricopeptide repeat-containing protein n=1 Tax=Linum tenue TaxID=586396 RepID=A0AAV0PWA0_9ROSI|nr:unnamed protein product [Linum tenue]
MLLHHHNPFHAMESCLQLNGISLTPSLLLHTLICLRHSSKIALSLFHYSLSLPSSPATSAAYNLMIDILAKVHQFDVCWQLTIQMWQQNDEDSDSQPNFTTFSVLIRRQIAAGFTRQAIRAFDDMQGFIGSVDSGHFYFLLDTSCSTPAITTGTMDFITSSGLITPIDATPTPLFVVPYAAPMLATTNYTSATADPRLILIDLQ